MAESKILVTGATGFTGGHLARRLAKDGESVRALVRDPKRATELSACGIEIVQGDLTDPASLAKAMEGIELVYHIAAIFRQENVTDQQMWDINCHGVKNMLDAAIAAGSVKRFVHCSTIGVHGDIKNPPATEETPYGPGDYYQESKTGGEKIAIEYMEQGKLPITIFRPGGIYGPRDMRFLKLFRPIKKRRFLMLGSGEILYQLVYIDDLVDGIILCGTAVNSVGNIYILTGEPALTLNQLVGEIADVVDAPKPKLKFPVMPVYFAGYLMELIFKPFGIEPPLYRRRVDFFRKDRSFSIEKARTSLGFEPKVDVKTGLARTAAWYEEQGLI
ncbi:MAG: NAD-dependent epimerase/dehydratase family protein [Chloroflexi bacterium]|nr:NAD-dependent epimerase/dehydratase family protein [Chloroflexota bacterium]